MTSRSQQKREAIMRGEEMPTFSGGSLTPDAFAIWLDPSRRKPSAYRLHYHAFMQGMHAGVQGADHKKDCPYGTNDYRAWWCHGCICGACERERAVLEAENRRLKEELAEMNLELNPHQIGSVAFDLASCLERLTALEAALAERTAEVAERLGYIDRER